MRWWQRGLSKNTKKKNLMILYAEFAEIWISNKRTNFSLKTKVGIFWEGHKILLQGLGINTKLLWPSLKTWTELGRTFVLSVTNFQLGKSKMFILNLKRRFFRGRSKYQVNKASNIDDQNFLMSEITNNFVHPEKTWSVFCSTSQFVTTILILSKEEKILVVGIRCFLVKSKYFKNRS